MSKELYGEPTAEELKLLEEHMAAPDVPAAEDDDSKPITPADVAAEKGVDPTTGKPVAEVTAEPDKEPAAVATPPVKEQTEDEKFAAWKKQHEGKTPEEIERLAFQQSQRANQAGFNARQAREAAEATSARIKESLAGIAARREALKTGRTEFDDKLANDPDAATRDVHERLLSADQLALDQEEFRLNQENMVTIAAQVIPDFHTAAPAIAAFGQEMNYTPEELSRITDPRDMATLYFASLTGRAIKAGIMDMRGNLLAAPPAVEATDPRLKTPTPVIATLGGPGGRTANGAKSLEDQLGDISRMNDKEMEAFEKANPGVLDHLLRQAG
jgi:hypothetical protein